MAAWFFVQTVFTLNGTVTAAQMTGLLGQEARCWRRAGDDLVRSRDQPVWQSVGAAQPELSLMNT